MIKAIGIAALILLTLACAVPLPAPTPLPPPPTTPSPTSVEGPYAQLSRSLAVCIFDNPAMHPAFKESMAVAKHPPAMAGMIELAIETGETTEAETRDALIACIGSQ